MTSIAMPELDYNSYPVNHGSYQLTKLVPQTGTQTFPITSGTEVVFELPPKVFNFAESYLRYDLVSDVNVEGNAIQHWIDGVCDFRQVQLYTRNGLMLLDCDNINYAMNLTSRYEEKIDDVINNDIYTNGSGYSDGLRINNKASGAATFAVRPNGDALNRPYTEPSYLGTSSATNMAIAFQKQLPLSVFHNTLLEIDKDLYFGGEILYLRLVLPDPTYVAFLSTSVTNPTTAARTITGAANLSLENTTLYLAIEQNQVIENSIKQTIMSGGLSLHIPYLYVNKQNLSGTSQSVSVRYNKGHGQKLKKLFWGCYTAAGTVNNTFNHNNSASAKVTSFYTAINNVRTSQFNYTIDNGDDWMVLKDKLKGSCILDSNNFYYNWFWLENFCDNLPQNKRPVMTDQNLVDGLDLSVEVKYDIFANTVSAAYDHYVIAVTDKILTVTPSGISLM